MKVKVSNIKWDATKEEAEECQLPNECILDVDEIEELVSDMISEKYGFCHSGFEIELT